MTPRKDAYMRGYADGWRDSAAHQMEILKEASYFILAPAEDLKEGVVSRIREAIAKAEGSAS